jgi:hypothetical protein
MAPSTAESFGTKVRGLRIESSDNTGRLNELSIQFSFPFNIPQSEDNLTVSVNPNLGITEQ